LTEGAKGQQRERNGPPHRDRLFLGDIVVEGERLDCIEPLMGPMCHAERAGEMTLNASIISPWSSSQVGSSIWPQIDRLKNQAHLLSFTLPASMQGCSSTMSSSSVGAHRPCAHVQSSGHAGQALARSHCCHVWESSAGQVSHMLRCLCS
jgi:hypothetical protein